MSVMNDTYTAMQERIAELESRWNSLYESVQTAALEATSNANQRLLMQVVTIMDELAGDDSEVQRETD